MAIKLSGPCKRVELLKMVLMNFKGFEGKVEILFNEKENEIIGDNGAGKSSVQDALIWVFTGRTKEGDSKSVEVINDDSNDCRVEVHFVDEDGDLHSIIRRQKKTKNGLLSTINLDFENILQKDLSVIIDDEKLLSIVNPMYFQSLDKDKAREVILSIMPEIKKEDVLNKIPGDKKDLIKDDSFELNDTNLYLTEQRRKIRELKESRIQKGIFRKIGRKNRASERNEI
jgi:DNA repair exonuclease SbcCD ATPase subunit